MMPDSIQLARLLNSVRLHLKRERKFLVESSCTFDKKHRPILYTIDEFAKADVKKMDKLIREVEAMLKEMIAS